MNIAVSVVARIVGGILALTSIGLIARTLGTGGFGQYTTVLAYLSTAGILADLGLYTLMTREISKVGADEQDIASNFFTLRIVSAVFFLCAACLAVIFLPYSQDVRLGALIAAPGYLFLSISQLCMGIFQKYLRLDRAALAELAGRAGQLVFVIAAVQAGGELFSFLWAMVGGAGLILAVNFFFAWRLVRIRLRADLDAWKRIARSTLPIAVSLVFTLLYFKADTIMLSLMKPQEDVGIYGAAYKVLETLAFFPAMFVGVLFPILSRAAAVHTEFMRVFQRAFALLGIAALPTVLGGMLLAPNIATIIGGETFLAAAEPLRVLFPALGCIFLGGLAGQSIVALNLQKRAMTVYFGGMAFNILANLVVIPRFSYMGAAWTTLATEAGVCLGLYALIFWTRRIMPAFSSLIRALPALLGMAVFIWLFEGSRTAPLPLVSFIGVFLGAAALYAALLFLFGALTKEDLHAVFSDTRVGAPRA